MLEYIKKSLRAEPTKQDTLKGKKINCKVTISDIPMPPKQAPLASNSMPLKNSACDCKINLSFKETPQESRAFDDRSLDFVLQVTNTNLTKYYFEHAGLGWAWNYFYQSTPSPESVADLQESCEKVGNAILRYWNAKAENNPHDKNIAQNVDEHYISDPDTTEKSQCANTNLIDLPTPCMESQDGLTELIGTID